MRLCRLSIYLHSERRCRRSERRIGILQYVKQYDILESNKIKTLCQVLEAPSRAKPHC